MEPNTNGSNDPARLDRIERIIEVLANIQSDMQRDLKTVDEIIRGRKLE